MLASAFRTRFSNCPGAISSRDRRRCLSLRVRRENTEPGGSCSPLWRLGGPAHRRPGAAPSRGLLGAVWSLGQEAVWGNHRSTVSGCFGFFLSQGVPMTSHCCVHSLAVQGCQETDAGRGQAQQTSGEARPGSAHGGGLTPAIAAESVTYMTSRGPGYPAAQPSQLSWLFSFIPVSSHWVEQMPL